MVDLDQCTHATINGWDKERRGWYPLPSSLSSSICLPSCPPCCPLPNCFSLMIARLHLCWHPPDRGLSGCRRRGCLMGRLWPPSTSLNLLRGRTLSSFFQTYHELTLSSPGASDQLPSFWTQHYVRCPHAYLWVPSNRVFVWRTSAHIWISFVPFRDGSNGPLRKLMRTKMGQRRKHRGESGAEVWLSESTMDGSGPGCTLLNKFKRHKQKTVFTKLQRGLILSLSTWHWNCCWHLFHEKTFRFYFHLYMSVWVQQHKRRVCGGAISALCHIFSIFSCKINIVSKVFLTGHPLLDFGASFSSETPKTVPHPSDLTSASISIILFGVWGAKQQAHWNILHFTWH